MSKAKLLCRIIRSAYLFAIAMAASSSLAIDSMVCGYHVYLAVWEPCVEERFIALHESGNPHDSHAMADYRDEDPGVGLGSPLSSLPLACPLLPLACSPLPLACSLLPLACLEVISVQRLGLLTGWDGRRGMSTGLYHLRQAGKCCGSAVDGSLVK